MILATPGVDRTLLTLKSVFKRPTDDMKPETLKGLYKDHKQWRFAITKCLNDIAKGEHRVPQQTCVI